MEPNIEIEKEDKSKELEERKRAEKEEEMHIQLALSILTGIFGGMAVNVLNGPVSSSVNDRYA